MIRRILIPMVAVAASLSVASVAGAQTSPPTTVETSTVERDVPVATVSEVDNDNDDDSDKTGLWGLLGLLGLAGLAGLEAQA